MMNKNNAFIGLCLGLSMAFQVHAQKPVAAPMKDVNQVIDNTLDSLNKARTARPVPGSSRKGNNPVLFLVGNSTMRTGTLGNGNNGQWGWGYFAHEYFDENRITVENHALGGTSSRTFYNRLWPEVLEGVRKGDWVIIDGQEGIVKKINMRSTELETWNKSNVIVPNALILSQSFVNNTLSDRMGRVEIRVAVDFDTDIPLVKNLLLNIAENDPDVLKSPPPSLLFTDLTDNSLVFQLNCYTANVYNSSAISFRIRKQIVEAFRENNITNPQTVVQSIIVPQNS